MFDNIIVELNNKWRIFADKIEKEMNANCESFGDLQPGDMYILPIIIGYQTKDFDKPFAGSVRDFFLRQEDAKNPEVSLNRLIGYAACGRAVSKSQEEFERCWKYLFEEIKLTLENHLKISPKEKGYGYYIKISNLVERDDTAAYMFSVESNFVPMIQIGRKKEDAQLRKVY